MKSPFTDFLPTETKTQTYLVPQKLERNNSFVDSLRYEDHNSEQHFSDEPVFSHLADFETDFDGEEDHDHEGVYDRHENGNVESSTDREEESETKFSTPKTIWVHNTDLNAPYFGGNFNFLYNGGASEAVITFNTHLSFRKNFSETAKNNFIDNLKKAVAIWDDAAEIQLKDINGNYNKRIKLRFKLNLVHDPKNSNKKTDVHPPQTWSSWFNGANREIVMKDLNVFIDSTRNILVHELGHVWGLLDEYNTKWIEKKFSPGHVGTDSPLLKDKIAIMNLGYQDEQLNNGEFRCRYFKHFGRKILEAFWGMDDFMIPVKHNGKIVATNVIGRIRLLKKDIHGNAPYPVDQLPFNPQFEYILITKKGDFSKKNKEAEWEEEADLFNAPVSESKTKNQQKFENNTGLGYEEIFEDSESFESEEPSQPYPINNETIAPTTSGQSLILSLATFLSPEKNLKTTQTNKKQIQQSGLALADIIAALNKFVDLSGIRQMFLDYNQNNSAKPYLVNNTGGSAADSVFTEAIHQFQIANYIDPNEHDGVLGRSTLETLGFINHGLKQKLKSSGYYGQTQLNRTDVKNLVSKETNNEFTVSNWYDFIVKPSWLGIKISDGIHVLLLRKLREAEAWLLKQPQYQGMTPATLGKALGFNANTKYSGARLSTNKQAMHGFGLAIDVNVIGNPWIGAGWIKYEEKYLRERYHMIDTLRVASGNKSLPGKTIFAYLDSIAQSVGNDSREAYKTLKQRNDEFITYLRTNNKELNYWRNSQTFGNRNPLNGFLNLHPDLVYALRQIAGLAWGAIDFGPNASGDIMHFDLRTIGVGKMLCEKISGFVPKNGHPTIINEITANESDYDLEFDDYESTNELEYHEAIEEAEWENEFLDKLNEDVETTEASFENYFMAEDQYDFDKSEEFTELEYYSKRNQSNKNCNCHKPSHYEFNGESLTDEVMYAPGYSEHFILEYEDPKSLAVAIMHDDLKSPVKEEEIIGLDNDKNLNIRLTTNESDSMGVDSLNVKLIIRTPGKTKTIVSENITVKKSGKDPDNSSNVLFESSISLKELSKKIGRDVKEIATVRRLGGTSDKYFIDALGPDWRSRGRAEQDSKCGTINYSLKDDRPDALKLFQAGGAVILELRDMSENVKVKRFLRDPADIFYFTGHGLGTGYSWPDPSKNCLAIEDGSFDHYCCWTKPNDLIPYWKSPMDLDALIIAGCSVLGIDGSQDPVSGDGLEWAKLLQVNGGPLLYLIGYGDWDPNENEGNGPTGGTAPLDSSAGNTIAKEIGTWIKSHPNLKGIIKQWLIINMSHLNPFGVGIDKDGVYWRTRRKATKGWDVQEKRTIKMGTKNINYVIETKKVM